MPRATLPLATFSFANQKVFWHVPLARLSTLCFVMSCSFVLAWILALLIINLETLIRNGVVKSKHR